MAASVCGLSVSPALANDTDGVTIQILSPSAGATVGGTVEVRYVVTAPSDVSLNDASVWLDDISLAGVDLAGHDCSAGCPESASIDTAVTPNSVNSSSYADGPHTIGIDVDTTAGSANSTSASVDVTLDNHRPTVTVLDEQPGTGLTADQSITIRAQVDGDGSDISSVRWTAPGNGAPTTTDMTPPTTAGGPWTLTIDTSGKKDGYEGSGNIQAVDDAGMSSVVVGVGYVVDHGPTVTGPTVTDPVLDDDLDQLTLGFAWHPGSYPTSVRNTTIVKSTVLLDGAVINTVDYPVLTMTGSAAGTLQVDSGERIPGGAHTLTYVLTDSRGKTGSVEVPVDVVTTLSNEWTAGAGAVVLPGEPVEMTAVTTSTDSPLEVANLTTDGSASYGGPNCSGCMQLTTDRTVSFTEPGVHTVELDVAPEDGWAGEYTTTVTVLPYARGRITTTSAGIYDVARTIHGSVTTGAGQAAAGASVTLQRDVAGAWQTVGTATSDSTGGVDFRIVQTSAWKYRLVTADLAGHWGGIAGTPTTLAVATRVTVTSHPAAIRRGKSFVVRAAADAPTWPSVQLQVYRGGIWRWVASRSPSTSGRVPFALTKKVARRAERGMHGSMLLRVVRVSTSGLAGSTSHSVRVRLRD